MSPHCMVTEPALSRVVLNRNVGPGWYLLRLYEPQIARAARPGQFVQVRCHAGENHDPILRRPFSIYAVDREAGTYDILYVTVGRGTRWMASVGEPPATALDAIVADAATEAAATVDVEGPFGNTFSAPNSSDAVYLIAGGVGVAPLYFFALELLAQAKPPAITLCMGARTREQLQGIEEFRALPIRCETATDDGSEGFHGRVTELLTETLEEAQAVATPGDASTARIRLYGCGPQGMNESLRKLATARGLPCEICLESLMACGFGICFGCVAPIRKTVDGEYFNRRICWEGPVFDARLLCEGIDGGHGD